MNRRAGSGRAANRTPGLIRLPSMRRRLLILILLAAAGCAGTGPELTTGAAPDPASLVGWWHVDGTRQVVLIDPRGLEIIDPEATPGGVVMLTGTWRADPEGRLLAQVDTVVSTAVPVSAEPDLDALTAYTPEWVDAAVTCRSSGADRVLVDERGTQVARLVPTQPVAGSGAVDPGRPVTDQERRRFGQAAPVPDGLRPVEPGDLVGRWVPDGVVTASFVEFAGDGSWTGSDGCNGAGGRWQAGSGGAFLATGAAVSTLMACDDMVDVGRWVADTRRMALDGQVLVLLDVEGRTVGRLSR